MMSGNSRKRALLSETYRIQKKRVCTSSDDTLAESSAWDTESDHALDRWNLPSSIPSDTKAALLYLKSLFSCEKFLYAVPPIVFKHQLYSIVSNRTQADRQLHEMRTSGEVRLFKLGQQDEDIVVVFSDDFRQHVISSTLHRTDVSQEIIGRFLKNLLPCCTDVSLTKKQLLGTFEFSDEEITSLVHAGLLAVRDMGSWWLSIPNAGLFMKAFQTGRKSVLTIIRKSKYHSILQQELEQKKLPKLAKLGMLYHIHDLCGASLVDKLVVVTLGAFCVWGFDNDRCDASSKRHVTTVGLRPGVESWYTDKRCSMITRSKCSEPNCIIHESLGILRTRI